MKHSTEIAGSTTISHVGYDEDNNELSVTFKNGGTYLYRGVSPEEHEALIKSPSTGKYFQSHIRPRYTGAKQASQVEELKAS